MRWRWVFLIGTPVAFGYALRQAANSFYSAQIV